MLVGLRYWACIKLAPWYFEYMNQYGFTADGIFEWRMLLHTGAAPLYQILSSKYSPLVTIYIRRASGTPRAFPQVFFHLGKGVRSSGWFEEMMTMSALYKTHTHSVFEQTHLCSCSLTVLIGKAASINIILFGFTRTHDLPQSMRARSTTVDASTIYHSRCDHTNHYTTERTESWNKTMLFHCCHGNMFKGVNTWRIKFDTVVPLQCVYSRW
jgi:hypothetical protein